jgi:hypothetical protein
VSIFDAAVGVFQKWLGDVAPVAQEAVKIDPTLSQSVRLMEVLAGVKAASELPWSEIKRAVAEHFSNVQDDLSTIEDVAKTVSPFLPDAIYVSDVAALLLLLIKLGGASPLALHIIKTLHGGTQPILGEDDPAADADWGKIAGF